MRERNVELADGLRARDDEVRQLVSVRLPALEDSPHPSTPHPSTPETGLLLDARLTGGAQRPAARVVLAAGLVAGGVIERE